MPRRKRSRRQRLDRQEQRQEGTDAGVPVKEETATPSQSSFASRVSLSGAGGGIIATGTFAASAVLFLIDDDGSLAWGLMLGLIALCFVPAIVVSLTPGSVRRRSVLRISTVGALAITGLLSLFDPGFLLLMMLPTALLAFGAGFIFQGSRASS